MRGIIVVAAALVAVVIGGCSNQPSQAGAPTTSTTTASTAKSATPSSGTSLTSPSTQQAQALAADLSSGDSARVAAAIGASAFQDVDSRLATELAKAGPLVFSKTMRPESDGVVTTSATLGSGAKAKTWDVRLVLLDGQWRLASTTLRSKP